MSAYATLSSGPMTYRGLHWDDGRDLGIKTGPVGAELFEQFAQAFGMRSEGSKVEWVTSPARSRYRRRIRDAEGARKHYGAACP
jgi:hypothetical protein